MKALLLGEGSSDLGENDPFADPPFRKGPMSVAIDNLTAAKGVEDIEYRLMTRGEVSKGIKATKRSISARPKGVDSERRNIYLSAWYLGTEALSDQRDFAVYFHDPDQTNSGGANTAELIERAMYAGFDKASYNTGVPMIPQPRSEAWLLAYFQKNLQGQHEYNKAERFENLPANDASPNSAKKLLMQAVGASSESETYAKVTAEIGDIDWTKIDMPSFNRFRKRLEVVLDHVVAGRS